MMTPRFYLIDGLLSPPQEWLLLARILYAEIPGAVIISRSHENATDEQADVIIGHSLGASKAADISTRTHPRLLIGIETVRHFWIPFGLEHGAAEAVSYRRSQWFGPVSVHLRNAYRYVAPGTDHNSVIGVVTNDVVEWVKQTIA